MPNRRRLLLAAGLAPFAGLARAGVGRVVVVGGGWGGLAVARHLRRLAPGLEVVVIERNPAFQSFVGSNRWLVSAPDATREAVPLRVLAERFGYRFVQAEVRQIDRGAGRVQTDAGDFAWDWLVLSPGIAEDWAAWEIGDAAAVAAVRQRYGGAMQSAADLPGLKQRLAGFRGGNLLMSIPPAPYRCPPAPYERALFLAGWLKQQQIPGKLIVADPNPLMPAYRPALLDRFKDQVIYLDHARIRAIDPVRRVAQTDVDDIPFDEALLSPPQRAADILHAAGLVRTDAAGRPGLWADQGAGDFRSALDRRIFLIGDAAGPVSPQFGYFPKTGQVAHRMGLAVAQQIAAEAGGAAATPVLPDSTCLVTTALAPDEGMRIETTYRRRGDGFLIQNVRQSRVANPLEEERAWAAALYGDFLGV